MHRKKRDAKIAIITANRLIGVGLATNAQVQRRRLLNRRKTILEFGQWYEKVAMEKLRKEQL